MSDTTRGVFQEGEECGDCRGSFVGKPSFKHWGPLVPTGSVGKFCVGCMQARDNESREGKEPRMVGVLANIET